MVEQYTGEEVSPEGLGGASMHARTSGVAHFVVPDSESADNLIAELLTYLPNSTDELPVAASSSDAPDRNFLMSDQSSLILLRGVTTFVK